MSTRIEDYALIGNTCTVALVSKDGSLDWLCVPRFDSAACFAALLGDGNNGRWQIAPAGEVKRVQRKYRENTLVLETEFETADGTVALIDFMPIRERVRQVDVVRISLPRSRTQERASGATAERDGIVVARVGAALRRAGAVA